MNNKTYLKLSWGSSGKKIKRNWLPHNELEEALDSDGMN